MDLRLYALGEDDFDSIRALGDTVHGKGYLSHADCEEVLRKSLAGAWNCSYVMYDRPRDQGKLIGFRLTYGPGAWEFDRWCTPEEWEVPPDKVCYFKSNTIDAEYRGQGIGSALLNISTEAVKKMGAVAGVTHIWMQSPGNSAFRYFTKNGGQVVKMWPDRWHEECGHGGYLCARCGPNCHCEAAEMILHFGE